MLHQPIKRQRDASIARLPILIVNHIINVYIQEYDLLKENFEKLKQENESLFDKYRRALAEAENSRKRGERQVEEAKIFAIQGFCKDLLEVN